MISITSDFPQVFPQMVGSQVQNQRRHCEPDQRVSVMLVLRATLKAVAPSFAVSRKGGKHEYLHYRGHREVQSRSDSSSAELRDPTTRPAPPAPPSSQIPESCLHAPTPARPSNANNRCARA